MTVYISKLAINVCFFAVLKLKKLLVKKIDERKREKERKIECTRHCIGALHERVLVRKPAAVAGSKS